MEKNRRVCLWVRPTLLTLTALVLSASLGAVAVRSSPPIDLSDYCNGADNTDDSACILSWIEAGQSSPGQLLYAPQGTYLYSQTAPLYSNTRIACEAANKVTFKRNGGSGIFLSAATNVHGVRIDKCGFDVDGSDTDFLAVISVNPSVGEPSTDIRVRNNRFFDSAIPGAMSAQQRQYILLLNCHDCRVEGNRLTEGGRIKVGRPGRQLLIRRNTVENANDNAITVVDIGDGISQSIVIEQNLVLAPKAVGIFFGADGEGQTSSTLTTRDVRVSDNRIRGDWVTGCIVGTLPAIAQAIRVHDNVCVKTGTAGPFQAGIVIKRTNGATQRATQINVERNRISSTVDVSSGGAAPLDMGGIFFSGLHAGVRVRRNSIKNVGPRAIYFHGVDILDVEIRYNTLVGGTLHIDGTVTGPTEPNTIVP
jgi:hypothetical protein